MKLIDWVSFLCLVIALVILWQFREILLLVFTSVVLAIALNSLVRSLVRRANIKRSIAVLITLALVVVFGALFVGLVLPPFIGQLQELLQLLPKALRTLINEIDVWINNPPPWLPQPELELLPQFSDLLQQIGNLASQLFGNFFTLFSNALAVVLQLLLVLVLTLMMLSNPSAYRQLMLRLFPCSYRRRADFILSACEASLLNWMAGIAINSLFVAILSGIGLLILGIRFVFAHALLAGVANFIPNIGPILSVVFPVSVALLDSPGKAITVIILYIVIQNLESYWFSPMVMQKQVALLPALTLVTQIFFATFLGLLGLILALPLAVVAKTWIAEALIKDILDVPPKCPPQDYPPEDLYPDLPPTVLLDQEDEGNEEMSL